MRLPSLIALSFALIVGTLGCVGELEPLDPAAGPGGGGPDAAVTNAAAKTYYETNIAPLMTSARPKGTCASCHSGSDPINGPDFLGVTAASGYDMLISNTRLVNPDSPATSVLLTRGDHSGDAWCTGAGTPYAQCNTDEVGLITQWMSILAQ